MYNIVLYPETIRTMTRSNKVTHKMTIIGKFTMLRILWNYIDCVSTLQLWTSHILYERSVSSCQNVVWRGIVKWGSLYWAAFKQGHRKLMMLEIVPFRTRYTISGCLHLRHLYTHRHIIYLWKAFCIQWYNIWVCVGGAFKLVKQLVFEDLLLAYKRRAPRSPCRPCRVLREFVFLILFFTGM